MEEISDNNQIIPNLAEETVPEQVVLQEQVAPAQESIQQDGGMSDAPQSGAMSDVEQTAVVQNPLLVILRRCKEVIAGKKQKKLEKILEFARQKGKITNADACKLLRISQATATRYFDELEKQGKIKQVGKTGHETFYQAI